MKDDLKQLSPPDKRQTKKVDLRSVFNNLNTKYFEGKLEVRKIYIVSSLRHVAHKVGKGYYGIASAYNPQRNDLWFNPDCLGDINRAVYEAMCLVASCDRQKYCKLLSQYGK